MILRPRCLIARESQCPPILDRASEYAYSRVVCGAHYASDIEASHVLGTELAMLMLQNPRFAADFDASRLPRQARIVAPSLPMRSRLVPS